MSDPRYGHNPYVPVYYHDLKGTASYAPHASGEQKTNVPASSSSIRKLKKPHAEATLPRHFLPPAAHGDKPKSAREIRHRQEMLQATWDKLTANERIFDDATQSMQHDLRVHDAPSAPGTYRFLPINNHGGGRSIEPRPAYGPIQANMGALPENFQPYLTSPTRKESFRLKVSSVVIPLLRELSLLVSQPGSLAVIRTSKLGRWKVGTYLSDEWYRDPDVSIGCLS